MFPLNREQRANGSEGLKNENPIHEGRIQHSCWHEASLETSSEAKTSPTTSLAGNALREQFTTGAGETEGDGKGDGEAMAEHEEAPARDVVPDGQGMHD